jgi:hypothetical protein
MAVEIKDYSVQVKALFDEYCAVGLEAIGQEAEHFAKDECPVDTGRLRNSITHNVDGKDVYIGSNVEYAVFVEYCDYHHETGNRHFLRNAAANHNDRYREIMKAALEGQSKT